MNDEQFDDLARKALAHDAGPPLESNWRRIKPQRWVWIPTVRETLVCGGLCAACLALVGLSIPHGRQPVVLETNPVIQAAIPTQSPTVLESVTWIAEVPRWPDQSRDNPMLGQASPGAH